VRTTFFANLLLARYEDEAVDSDQIYELAVQQERYLKEFLAAFEDYLWEKYDSVDPVMLEVARREMTPKRFWDMVRENLGSLSIDEGAFNAFHASLLRDSHTKKKASTNKTKGVLGRRPKRR